MIGFFASSRASLEGFGFKSTLLDGSSFLFMAMVNPPAKKYYVIRSWKVRQD